MGEAAEMELDGTCCQVCGEFLFEDDPAGYPITCGGCGGEDSPDLSPRQKGRKRREKRRKARQRKAKEERLATQDSTGWEQHTEYHWSKTLCGMRLDFWPSTQKCQFNGKVYQGVADITELEKTLEESIK